MIKKRILTPADRAALIKIARKPTVDNRVARRANALVLLDDGHTYAIIAQMLLLDDDTVRIWRKLYEEQGIHGLENFDYAGSKSRLNEEQEIELKAWINETLPRSTAAIASWIRDSFEIEYANRSSIIKLLDRLGFVFVKPKAISRNLDEGVQKDFIKKYNDIQKSMEDDESCVFVDAVHPTHAVRPVGCWVSKEGKTLAVEQASGRQRLNLHGAIDLETGKTFIHDVESVNALSTIALLQGIQESYPQKRIIHVFLDNARYHHAKLTTEWLKREGARIKLHFLPVYCPHLNPIERLWGLMHREVTHNRCYKTFAEFSGALKAFLKDIVPMNWSAYCDRVTDNFKIMKTEDYRVV